VLADKLHGNCIISFYAFRIRDYAFRIRKTRDCIRVFIEITLLYVLPYGSNFVTLLCCVSRTWGKGGTKDARRCGDVSIAEFCVFSS
jgi:hypothetical protein